MEWNVCNSFMFLVLEKMVLHIVIVKQAWKIPVCARQYPENLKKSHFIMRKSNEIIQKNAIAESAHFWQILVR